MRVDPTAAVSPERVMRGRSLRPPPGLVAGTINAIDPAFAARLRSAWETVNNRWNQWVLNYSRGQQFDLLKQLGFESPSWQDLASTLILFLCTGALAGAAWAWWDRRRLDPWQRLQLRVQRQLGQLGVAVAPHHGPRERARLLRQALGGAAEAAAQQLDALDAARYGATAPRWQDHGRWWRGFRAAARAVPRS
jgi:hypothetical protein